jgi:hypothetical protein
MENCSVCGQLYNKFLLESKRPFEGGLLIVTEIPSRKCNCEVLISLGDGAVIDYYRMELKKHGIIGEIRVSLIELIEKYGRISDIIETTNKTNDLNKKMVWMKEKLGLVTDEELFSKALTLLHMSIELEDRGFTVKGSKDNFFTTENINFGIRKKEFNERD